MTVPDNTWVFVALVVTPSNATIHMYDGTQWTAYTRTAAHGLQYFGGVDATYVGRDPGDAARYFRGAIDDVRIYDYALDLTAIQAVALNGGKAANPCPRRVARPRSPAAISGGRRPSPPPITTSTSVPAPRPSSMRPPHPPNTRAARPPRPMTRP